MLQVVFCDVGKGRARGSLLVLELVAVWPWCGAGAALVLGDGELRLKGLYRGVPGWTSPLLSRTFFLAALAADVTSQFALVSNSPLRWWGWYREGGAIGEMGPPLCLKLPTAITASRGGGVSTR